MDEFFIDEPAPPSNVVPEPASVLVWSVFGGFLLVGSLLCAANRAARSSN